MSKFGESNRSERCKDVWKDEILGFLASFSVNNIAHNHGRKWDCCLSPENRSKILNLYFYCLNLKLHLNIALDIKLRYSSVERCNQNIF